MTASVETQASPAGSMLGQLNTWYFVTLRDVASRSLAAACQQFHVTTEAAKLIRDMPIEELHKLANLGECMVVPRLAPSEIKTVLTSHASGGHGAVVAALVS